MSITQSSYISNSLLDRKPNKSNVLRPPFDAIDFEADDINGNRIKLSDYKGRGVLLCFLRNTDRPLRNQRLLELTRKYKEWSKIGVEVIVIFNEANATLRTLLEAKPRPFPVIADPKLKLHREYGVQRLIGKGVVAPTNLPSPGWLNRLFRGNFAWLNPTGRIMPADFLINTEGKIISSWYGQSEHDYIPNERLETFAIATRIAVRKLEKR